jgi:hypothetical protein
VIIHQHLDQTLTLMIAGHRVGHYSAEGKLLTPLTKKQVKAVEKTLRQWQRILSVSLVSLGRIAPAVVGSYGRREAGQLH